MGVRNYILANSKRFHCGQTPNQSVAKCLLNDDYLLFGVGSIPSTDYITCACLVNAQHLYHPYLVKTLSTHLTEEVEESIAGQVVSNVSGGDLGQGLESWGVLYPNLSNQLLILSDRVGSWRRSQATGQGQKDLLSISPELSIRL